MEYYLSSLIVNVINRWFSQGLEKRIEEAKLLTQIDTEIANQLEDDIKLLQKQLLLCVKNIER